MWLSRRVTGRGLVAAVVALMLLATVLLQLNLLGLTNFPIVRRERTERDEMLARVLSGVKNQCRFGDALVSAGQSRVSKGTDARLRSDRFARVYAASFGGTSEQERRRIRDACRAGLSHSSGE
jgi:hypothetical protein